MLSILVRSALLWGLLMCTWTIYCLNLPYHFLGRLNPLSSWPVLCVHSLARHDNCPFWISRRERMTAENFHDQSPQKEYCRTRRGTNLRPPDQQSDAHPNEPVRPYFKQKVLVFSSSPQNYILWVLIRSVFLHKEFLMSNQNTKKKKKYLSG